MRTTLVLLACLIVIASMGASGLALKDRFDQGTKSRIAICESENTLRQVLHDEHLKKLANQEAFLKEHPNGIPGIPAELIERAIADEREIVAKTRPRTCQ